MRIRLLKEKDWGWVKERMPVRMVEDTGGVVCLNDKDELVAAAVFDSTTHNGVNFSLAMDNAYVLLEGFFDRVYSYVFDYLGKDFVYTYIRDTNEKSLTLAKTLGFKKKTYFDKGHSDTEGYTLFEIEKKDVVIPSFVNRIERRAA